MKLAASNVFLCGSGEGETGVVLVFTEAVRKENGDYGVICLCGIYVG